MQVRTLLLDTSTRRHHATRHWRVVFRHAFIWWLLWIAFLATAFTTVAPVPRSLLKKGERALDILRRRYAAGQMTTDEYERRKAVLERDEPGTDQC